MRSLATTLSCKVGCDAALGAGIFGVGALSGFGGVICALAMRLVVGAEGPDIATA